MFASQLSVKQFILVLDDSEINKEIYKVIEYTKEISSNHIHIQFRNYENHVDKIIEIVETLGYEYSYSCVGDIIVDIFEKYPNIEFWLNTNTIVQWLKENEEKFRKIPYHSVVDTHLDNGINSKYFDELTHDYVLIPKEDTGCVYTERCYSFDSETESDEFITNLLKPIGFDNGSSFTTYTSQLERILSIKNDKPIWIKKYPRCAMIRKNVCIDNLGNVYGCLKKMNVIGHITDDFLYLKYKTDEDILDNTPFKCKECPVKSFCGSCSYKTNLTMCEQTDVCFDIIKKCGKLTTPIEL